MFEHNMSVINSLLTVPHCMYTWKVEHGETIVVFEEFDNDGGLLDRNEVARHPNQNHCHWVVMEHVMANDLMNDQEI